MLGWQFGRLGTITPGRNFAECDFVFQFNPVSEGPSNPGYIAVTHQKLL